MGDGSIKIGVELETDKFKKNLQDIKTTNRKNFEEIARDTGKSVDEIKKDVEELAKSYQSKSNMQFQDAYKKAHKEIGLTSKSTADKVSKDADKIGTSYKNAALQIGDSFKKGFAAAIGASVAVGGASVAVAMKLEKQLSRVGAISGASAKDMEMLETKAKEMGATTQFSATESAEALEYMALAGWNTGDMLDGLSGVMNLAAASGEDLALVSDIVTDGLTAFGMSAKDSTKFADVLATTTSNANTNVSMLGESFKYVAPVAGALGYSIEDTSVALGLMANAGVKASSSGAALRTIMANLASPSKTVATAMADLGVSITDANGNMLPFNDVLQQLRGSFVDLADSEKAQYAEMLAGKEGMSGLLAVVNASEADFNKLTNSINSSAGASEQMANRMQNNLQGQLTKLKSTSEAIGLSFGQVLTPAVIEIVKKLQSFADVILNLDDGQKKLLLTIPLLSIGLIGLGTVVFKSYNAVKTLHNGFMLLKSSLLATSTGALAYNKTQNILNSTLATFKSPLGIAVTALGMLTIAFKDVDEVSGILKGTLTVLLATLTTFKIVTTIQRALKGLTIATIAQNTATKAVTTATKLWNLALKANPVGLVVTSVVALGTALTSIVKHFTKATDGAKVYNKESQKIIESNKQLNDSVEESSTAYIDNNKRIDNSIQANKMLAKEIQNLASVEDLSKGQKLLLKQKIDELNSSVDGLALSYNEETGQLNLNNQALEEQFKIQQAQLQLSSGLEEQTRIRQDIATATELQEQALSRLADVTLQLNDRENLAYGDRKLLLDQQKELQQTTIDTQATIDNLNVAYDEISANVEKNAAIVEQANETKVKAEEQYQGALNETGKSMELLSTLTEEEKEKAQKTLEELTKYTTDAFNTINNKAALSVDDLINNLNSNINTVEQWTNDISVLMERGVDEAFIQTLREAGPQVSNTVSAIAKASDEKIKELNEVFEKGTNTAVNSMLKQFGLAETINAGSNMINDVAESMNNNTSLNVASENAIKDAKTTMVTTVDKSRFDNVGKEIVTGIAQGVKDNKSVVNNAIRDVASSAVTTFKKELDIHSPSRVFKQQSKYINDGIAKGIEESSNVPIKSLEKVTNSLIDVFQESKNFKDVGENLINSFTDGIDKNKKDMTDSIYNLVKDVSETAYNKIDTKSNTLINKYTNVINKKINNNSVSKTMGAKLIEDYTDSIQSSARNKKEDIKNTGYELMNAFKTSLEEGANRANELVKQKLSSLTASFQNEADNLKNAQKSLEKSLSDTKLFEFDEDNNLIVENLDKTINKLDEYDKAIANLKGKGISDAILNELSNYSVDEVLKITENLLKMTDEEFDNLNKKWAEKKNKATEIAANFYAEQMEVLEKDFKEKLINTLNNLPNELENIGIMTITGFEDGVKSRMESIKTEVRYFADSIVSEMTKALDIHSPSKKMQWIGRMTMDGYNNGIAKSSKNVLNNIANLPIIETFKNKVGYVKNAVNGAMNAMIPKANNITTNKNIQNITNNSSDLVVNANGITVRDDNDILRLSQELYTLFKSRNLAKGMS